MKLAVCRDELRPIPQRQRREQSRDELMRVLAERDVAVGIAKQTPESSLHQRRLLSRALPFRIHELRGVEPRLLLRLESNVRPGLVRMTGQQKPLGDAEPRIVLCKLHFRIQISEFRLISDCSFRDSRNLE
jgi:hypothetical protein